MSAGPGVGFTLTYWLHGTKGLTGSMACKGYGSGKAEPHHPADFSRSLQVQHPAIPDQRHGGPDIEKRPWEIVFP